MAPVASRRLPPVSFRAGAICVALLCSALPLSAHAALLTSSQVPAMTDLYNAFSITLPDFSTADCSSLDLVSTCNDNGEVLDLSISAQQGSFPDSISALSTLTTLSVEGSKLTPPLQPAIASIVSLVTMSFTFNEWSSESPFLSDIGNLTNLVSLSISYNSFNSDIPSSLFNLTKLTLLDMSYNYFSGSFSSDISNLQNLVSINLQYNSLTDAVPGTLGSLPLLQYLVMNDNYFSNSIPDSLSNLSTLTWFNLADNKLNGTLSENFSALKILEYFNVEDNKITGSLPLFVTKLTALSKLRLEENYFQGTIPSAYGLLSNLIRLNLNYNILTSTIPSSLSRLSLLTQLTMDKQYLYGTIPAGLLKLPNIVILNVANNALSGTLPAFQFPDATLLQFKNNFLYGTVTAASNGCQVIQLDGNCFSPASPCSPGTQKDPSACAAYCGAGPTQAPCNGLGVCVPQDLTGASGGGTFACRNCVGYTANYGNRLRCVSASCTKPTTGRCRCPPFTSPSCRPNTFAVNFKCCCASGTPWGLLDRTQKLLTSCSKYPPPPA